MDKHVSVLHLCVSVVPNDAALAYFNEAAVDVVCVSLHDLFDLVDPAEVIELCQLLPAFLIAGAVEVA